MKFTTLVADPDNPFRVQRSHLGKTMLAKSSSSCRAALVLRPHRSAMLQEILCDSWEEHEVALCLAALPWVREIREQAVTVPYHDANGRQTRQRIDFLCRRSDGKLFAISVKYAAKARRPDYRAEIAALNRHLPPEVANRAMVLSRQHFHPQHRANAQQIHMARRGWDPDADRLVLDMARRQQEAFTLGALLGATGLEEGRGWRAALRLVGDGDIRLAQLERISECSICGVAA